jgi:hypothetical protein
MEAVTSSTLPQAHSWLLALPAPRTGQQCWLWTFPADFGTSCAFQSLREFGLPMLLGPY